MEKGYYCKNCGKVAEATPMSQSTIKMEKGYYKIVIISPIKRNNVAIHNKNGKGLLLEIHRRSLSYKICRNPQ